jgi:hypothetical protein
LETELGDPPVCHSLSAHADVDHQEGKETCAHQELLRALQHQVAVWTAEVGVVEGAYCRGCQAEDPLEVEAFLEEVPVGEVAFLAEIALEGIAAVGFVYSPENLGIHQGMEAAPFARLDFSNVGQEVAVLQVSRCIGNPLSQHSYSFLPLEVLL